jgi:HlyD family secretion protein
MLDPERKARVHWSRVENRSHLSSLSARAVGAVALAGLGFLAVASSGCGGWEGSAEAAVVPVDAGARLGEFSRDLLLTGELQAVNSIAINSPQTAIFQMRIQFMAEEGTEVQEGDPVLDFDNSALADQLLELETQILDAEIQLVAKHNEIESTLKDLEITRAENQYAHDVTRLEADIDEDILPRREHSERQLAYRTAASRLEETIQRAAATRDQGDAEMDVLRIQRDKLKKDLESANGDLELLSIKAPAAGLVTYETRSRSTTRWQEGDSCWPGQTVMRLPDLSEMQVAFYVNEVDANLLEVGMPVEIAMDSFPGRRLEGKITMIPSMAVSRDEESKVMVFKVISSLSETWTDAMKPGMSVRGQVVVERRQNAPMVPRDWVVWDGDEAWLLLPGENAEERRRMLVHPVIGNTGEYVLDIQQDADALAALGLALPLQKVEL